MNISAELLLVAGAFAIYAWDAAHLLYADQFILEGQGTRWRAREGASALVAGRRPMLPDLLRPALALLPVSVDRLLREGQEPANDVRHFLMALRPLGRAATTLLLMFFPGLPLVLHLFGSGVELLGWLVLVYAVIGTIIWRMWRYRRVLELPPRTVLAYALECLLCAPLAINIVRKLGMRAERIGLHNAREVLGHTGGDVLRATAAARIDDMLSYLPPDAPAAGLLLERRSHLVPEAAR